MKHRLWSLLKKPSRGAGMAEYSLLVGLIALLCLGGVVATGTSVKDIYQTVTNALSDSAEGEMVEEGLEEDDQDIALEYDLPEGSMVLSFEGSEVSLYLVKGAGEAVVHWRTAPEQSVAASGVMSHTFADEGPHVVGISGDISSFESRSDNLVEVMSFGDLPLTSLRAAFQSDYLLQAVAPLPSTVKNLSYAFASADANEGSNPAGLDTWDTSGVSDFSYAFYRNALFNGDISSWDVSDASSYGLAYMFNSAGSFTGDLGDWCVENVVAEPVGFGATFAIRQPAWGYCGSPDSEENPEAMVLTVQGDETRLWLSNNQLGLATIYWGDGAVSTHNYTAANSAWLPEHSYLEEGIYKVQIELPGGPKQFRVLLDTVVSVDQWGAGLTSLGSAFANMGSLASVPLLPATVTDLSGAFGASSAGNAVSNPAGLAAWDVSNVTNMAGMFRYNDIFDQDVSNWDVSAVPSWSYMQQMFDGATGVTADLGNWCVDKIVSEPTSFGAPNAARQPAWGYCGTPQAEENPDALMFTVSGDSAKVLLSGGTTGVSTVFWGDGAVSTYNLTNANAGWTASHAYAAPGTYQVQVEMPGGTDLFRVQEDTVISVDQWGTGLKSLGSAFANMASLVSVPPLPATVTDLSGAFSASGPGYPASNPTGLAAWDVSNVSNMASMFSYNEVFDQDVSGWNVSGVTSWTYMQGMFLGATGMTADLGDWCVDKMTAEPSNFGAPNAARQPAWGYCGTPQAEENPDALMLTVSGDSASFSLSGATSGLSTIFWGDGAVSTWSTTNHSTGWSPSHSYATPGTYEVQIEMAGGADLFRVLTDTVISVDQWGKGLTSLTNAFVDMSSLASVPPLPATITILTGAFKVSGAGKPGPNPAGLSEWDVSHVTKMDFLFSQNADFDQDISNWDVSGVSGPANMASMFYNATGMTSDLGGWCVDKIVSEPGNFGAPNASRQPVWGYCGTPEPQESDSAILLTVTGDSAQFNLSSRASGLSTIFWGDGQVSTWNTTNATLGWTVSHAYKSPGTYKVQIEMRAGADLFRVLENTVTSVEQWGTGITSLANAFVDMSALASVPPLPAQVTNISGAFKTSAAGKSGPNPAGLDDWDVSQVTRMDYLFSQNADFDRDVSDWDVSGVTSSAYMAGMFNNAAGMTSDLGGWCVDKIVSEPSNFGAPNAARQPTWGYCGTPEPQENSDALMLTVSGDSASMVLSPVARGLSTIFWGDGEVSTWNTTNSVLSWTATHDYKSPGTYKVQIEMSGGTDGFQVTTDTVISVDQWAPGLTSLASAFKDMSAIAALPPLPQSVVNLSNMFAVYKAGISGADPQGLSDWDVSRVTRFDSMFSRNEAFSQDVSGWDVSGVTIGTFMSNMFYNAIGLTSDLSGWCVSNITSEPGSFGAPNAAAKPIWGTCP